MEKEAEEALKQQRAMFGLGSNTPPTGDEDEPDVHKKPGGVDE